MARSTLIIGVTPDGKPFRPSNWNERLAGFLSTFEGQRIRYSPLLQPDITPEGHPCLQVSHQLQDKNPSLYQCVMDFAKENHLTSKLL